MESFSCRQWRIHPITPQMCISWPRARNKPPMMPGMTAQQAVFLQLMRERQLEVLRFSHQNREVSCSKVL